MRERDLTFVCWETIIYPDSSSNGNYLRKGSGGESGGSHRIELRVRMDGGE